MLILVFDSPSSSRDKSRAIAPNFVVPVAIGGKLCANRQPVILRRAAETVFQLHMYLVQNADFDLTSTVLIHHPYHCIDFH